MVAKTAPKPSATRLGKSAANKPVKAVTKKPAKAIAERKAAKDADKKGAKRPAKSLISVRVELATYCGRCMRPLVLDRVAARVTCRACLHPRPLATGDWSSMAARAVTDAVKGKREAGMLSTDFGDEYTVRSRVGRAEPTCNECGAAVSCEFIVNAIGEGEIGCACGSKMSVRAPDERGRAVAWNALAIANEATDAAPAHAKVMFRCLCGAGLAADGSARAVRCARCGSVDVPEALWNVLRPVRPRSPMFFVLPKE